MLERDELRPLQTAMPRPDGNIALIAAGTGLGESFLHWVDGRYVPMASEGGHTDFAARTDREIEFVRFLRARYGRAEIEHVLSGPGLLNLADFTHARDAVPMLGSHGDPPDLPAEVSGSALGERVPVLRRGARHVCRGVWRGRRQLRADGGHRAAACSSAAASRRGSCRRSKQGAFIDAFTRQGSPMRPLLEAMPVHVILNPEAGLLGAAVYAATARAIRATVTSGLKRFLPCISEAVAGEPASGRAVYTCVSDSGLGATIQQVLEPEVRDLLLHRVLPQPRVQVGEVDAIEVLILVVAGEDELLAPVAGSTWRCRHCAQTSFIMHCIGELMLPMPTCAGLRYGASAP